ncbi:MAG: hypothetical protein HZA16_14680 [Nitrospirae bacterium]|nr:hypothetical protein [Nitrospirota bacterium]
MGYSNVALKDKIMEMYPEIGGHGISMGIDFNRELKTYDIKLRKNSHELVTHLEKIDADECMDNIKCIYLGVKIGEFIKNFEEKEMPA